MQSPHAVNFEVFIKSGTGSTVQGNKGHPSRASLVTSQYSTATAMWEETLAMGQRKPWLWGNGNPGYAAMGSSFNTDIQDGVTMELGEGTVTQDGGVEPCPCLLLNAWTPFLKYN